MDPDLRKLLIDAHAAGATEEQLHQLIDKWHADHGGIVDVSADLQKQADAAQARAAAAPGDPFPVRYNKAATEVLSGLQGIPGMRAVEAKGRSLVTGKPYRVALSELDDATNALPTSHKIVGRMIGAAPLALIPGSPGLVGAGVGAAHEALNADPDQSLLERGGRTAAGGVTGYALGKLGEAVVTKGRALATPDRAKNLIAREAKQAEASTPLYNQALAEGQGVTQADPNIRRFTQYPTVQAKAKNIRALDDLKSIPRGRSPEMLDKVYKSLTDEETALEGQLATLDKGPKSGNDPRQALENVRALKAEALKAYGGPMPTYPKAVQTFAEHQGGIEGVKRGYQTATNAASAAHGGVNQTEFTPAGLKRYVSKQPSPFDRTAVSEGILAKTKERPNVAHLGRIPIPVLPSPTGMYGTLRDASLLRTTNAPGQQFAELLTKLLSTSTPNALMGAP